MTSHKFDGFLTCVTKTPTSLCDVIYERSIRSKWRFWMDQWTFLLLFTINIFEEKSTRILDYQSSNAVKLGAVRKWCHANLDFLWSSFPSVILLCPKPWVLVSQKDPHSPPLCMTSFLNDSLIQFCLNLTNGLRLTVTIKDINIIS